MNLLARITRITTGQLCSTPERTRTFGLLLCTGAGKPFNPRNVLRSFAAIITRAGVPRISIDDLRHTHATLLLRDGVPVKVVSERLGPAQASITLDGYAHVVEDMQEQAVDSIGAALFG